MPGNIKPWGSVGPWLAMYPCKDAFIHTYSQRVSIYIWPVAYFLNARPSSLCTCTDVLESREYTFKKKNRAWSKMCGYMIRAPGSMVSWREMIQIDCPGIEANHGAPVCLIAGPVNPLAFRGAKTAYWIPTTKLFCRQCTTWYPLHVLVGLNLEAKNKSRGKGLIVVLVHAVVLQVMRVPLMGSGLLGCAYGFLWKAWMNSVVQTDLSFIIYFFGVSALAALQQLPLRNFWIIKSKHEEYIYIPCYKGLKDQGSNPTPK